MVTTVSKAVCVKHGHVARKAIFEAFFFLRKLPSFLCSQHGCCTERLTRPGVLVALKIEQDEAPSLGTRTRTRTRTRISPRPPGECCCANTLQNWRRHGNTYQCIAQPLQSSRSDKVPTKAETGSDADVYPTLKPADPYCPQGSWDDDLELADPSPFFQCDICKNAEKRFTGSDVLLKHMRTVHGCERPHVCPLCAHGFPLADLKRHNKGQGQCGGKRSSMSSSNVLVDGKPPSFKQPDSNVSVKNYNRIFGNYTYAKDQKGISSSTTPQANLETIYPSSTSHIEPPMESSMEFIIFTVSKEISSTDSDFLLNVEWDLLGFMRNQFVDFSNANLGSVITLTGTAQNAQATTCLDYAERNWPFQGSMLIEAFQSAIDSDVHTSKGSSSLTDTLVSTSS